MFCVLGQKAIFDDKANVHILRIPWRQIWREHIEKVECIIAFLTLIFVFTTLYREYDRIYIAVKKESIYSEYTKNVWMWERKQSSKPNESTFRLNQQAWNAITVKIS